MAKRGKSPAEATKVDIHAHNFIDPLQTICINENYYIFHSAIFDHLDDIAFYDTLVLIPNRLMWTLTGCSPSPKGKWLGKSTDAATLNFVWWPMLMMCSSNSTPESQNSNNNNHTFNDLCYLKL